MNLFSEIKNDKDKLLQNFVEIKSLTNIGVLKCNKLIIKKDYIKNNIGFYIFPSIIIIYLILFFFFLFKGFNTFIYKIKLIINNKNDAKNERKKDNGIKTNPLKNLKKRKNF